MIRAIARPRLLLMLGLIFSLFIAFAQPVVAQTSQERLCRGAGGVIRGGECVDDSGGVNLFTNEADSPSIFRRVADILLFITGAVSVIMLIIGGLRYVLSNGDANAVGAAKNTILYAIIGLIVTFLAFAAVSFVVGQLSGTT